MVVAPVVAALMVRLLLLAAAWLSARTSIPFAAPDSDRYLRLGEAIRASGRFALDGAPELLRTPGYPGLLAVAGWLGEPAVVILLFQVVLGAATVGLVAELARRVLPNGCSAAAAWLLALEPMSILYSTKLLTETSYAALLVAGLLAIVRYCRTGDAAGLVWGGIVLGLSSLVRPVGAVVSASLLLWLMFRANRRPLVHALMFSAVSFGPIAAWQMRNLVQAGYGGFSAVADTGLYFYVGASILASREGRSYYAVQDSLGHNDERAYLQAHPEQVGWSEAERFRWMGEQGRALLRTHFGAYLPIHAAGMARTLADPGAIEYLKMFGRYPPSGGLLGRVVDAGPVAALRYLLRVNPFAFWSTLMLGAVVAGLLVTAAVGTVRPRLWRDPGAQVLLVAGLALWVASGGPNGVARLRVPIVPIICVLAAAGLPLRRPGR